MNNNPSQESHVVISKPIFIGLLTVVCLLFFAVCYLLLQRTTPATPSGNKTTAQNQSTTQQPVTQNGTGNPGTKTDPHVTAIPTKEPLTPEAVTSTFYNWYFSFNGDPLKPGEYLKNELLTSEYRDVINDFVRTYKGTKPSDPIFCVKNKTAPSQVIYEPAVLFGDKMKVKIRRLDGKYLYTAWLIQQHGKWVIDDITCTP